VSDQEREQLRPGANGSWPPFEPGNELSTRHGAYSPRRVEPLAGEILEHLLADQSIAHLAAPRWRLALLALCRAEAQVQLLSEYLAKAGEESGDGVGDLEKGRVLSAYLLLHRCEARAITMRARLGLDPLSAARWGRTGRRRRWTRLGSSLVSS
jgi:hypothetical protein